MPCKIVKHYHDGQLAYFMVEAVQEFASAIPGGPAIREMFVMDILPPARALALARGDSF